MLPNDFILKTLMNGYGIFLKKKPAPCTKDILGRKKNSIKKCTINSGVVPRGGAGAFPVQFYGNHNIHILGSICLFGLESCYILIYQ